MIIATQRPDSKSKGTFHNFKNSTRVYIFCHRSGHTINLCYQKHGHPNFNKHKFVMNVSNMDNNETSQWVYETLMVSYTSNNALIS